MNFFSRLPLLLVLAAGGLLSACGQKGALTLPDTSAATPIVIREAQAAGSATAPAPAPVTAPVTTPATVPAATPTTPTPPQH